MYVHSDYNITFYYPHSLCNYQVPQFLYEAGFCQNGQLIGITQPRRVAVTSTAQRVLFEMTSGEESSTRSSATNTKNTKEQSTNSTTIESKKRGNTYKTKQRNKSEDVTGTLQKQMNDEDNSSKRGQLVGYQIRFDSRTIGPQTRIKFMTDGILLKEVSQDLMLRKYNVIILDEAHERNMNTDVLLGMLSRVIPLRRAEADYEQAKYATLTEEEKLNYNSPIEVKKHTYKANTLTVKTIV